MTANAYVSYFNQRDKEEPCLIIECEKFANAIIMDFPISVYTIDKREAAKLRKVYKGATEYSPIRAAKRYFEDVNVHGITAGAERILFDYLNGKEVIEDCKPSENAVTESAVKAAYTAAAVVPLAKPIRARPTGRVYDSVPPTATELTACAERPAQPPLNGSRGNIVAQLAAEFAIDAADVRKALRKAGMHQPYSSIDDCRSALKGNLRC